MCFEQQPGASNLVNGGVVTEVGQVAPSLGVVPRVAREQHLLQSSAAFIGNVNTLD